MKSEGIDNIWKSHESLAYDCRQGCNALGMRLFSNSPSFAVTPVWIPEGVKWSAFNKALKNSNGITVAAGQDEYKDKIFRVSHLGFYDELDMLTVIGGIERALKEINFAFEIGAGVSAVQKAFLGN